MGLFKNMLSYNSVINKMCVCMHARVCVHACGLCVCIQQYNLLVYIFIYLYVYLYIHKTIVNILSQNHFPFYLVDVSLVSAHSI